MRVMSTLTGPAVLSMQRCHHFVLNPITPNTTHAIRPSCRKTANTTPPQTIASLPIETLLTLLSLKKNRAPHPNATYMVPKAETTHEIWVEADVERAMHLYLVNGINLILEVFPNETSRLLSRSEVGS